MAAHHDTCVKTGAVIVPQAGFDSVPSDIGRCHRQAPHDRCTPSKSGPRHVHARRALPGRYCRHARSELAVDPARQASSIRSATKTKIDWTHGTGPGKLSS